MSFDPIRQWIYRCGSHSQRSLRFFIAGLLLFIVAGGFIALGYYYQYWWQIFGLVLGPIAVMLAAYGYFGLLANRISQILINLENNAKRFKG